jgi:hypothetical protein
MNFSVEIRWELTQDAFDRIQSLWGNAPPVFEYPVVGLYPLIGDYVSFPGPGYEKFTFVVRYREFKFQDGDCMTIKYILDILLEEDQKKMLRLVK